MGFQVHSCASSCKSVLPLAALPAGVVTQHIAVTPRCLAHGAHLHQSLGTLYQCDCSRCLPRPHPQWPASAPRPPLSNSSGACASLLPTCRHFFCNIRKHMQQGVKATFSATYWFKSLLVKHEKQHSRSILDTREHAVGRPLPQFWHTSAKLACSSLSV